jgi:tetratricopeptide (TPR) repeat protein
MKPRLFIGSARENIEIAYAAQQNLHDSAEITVWDQGIFNPSQSNLESLLSALDGFDIGLFIFAPDDLVKIRGAENQTVRDNVLFELGLFVGRLGRKRCFILMPQGETLHIPTDLIGMNPVLYESDRRDKNHRAGTGPACNEIRSALKREGFINLGSSTTEAPSEGGPSAEIQPNEAEKEDASHTAQDLHQKDWISAYVNNEYHEAIRLIEADLATEQDEQEKILLTRWLGLTKFEENAKAGLQFLHGLVQASPQIPEYSNLLASSYQKAGFYEEAIRATDQGLQETPGNVPLTLTRSTNLSLLGKHTEAIVTLLQGLKRDAETDSYYLALADAFIQINKKQAAGAILELGLTKTPLSESLLYKYSKILFDLGELARAILAYRKLTKISPLDAEYPTLLGNSYLKLDAKGLALDAYNEANKLAEEKQGWIIANIGNLYNNCGLYTLAIEHLERALVLAPESQYSQERLLRARQSYDKEHNELEAALKEAASAPRLLDRFEHNIDLEDLVSNELPEVAAILSNSDSQEEN